MATVEHFKDNGARPNLGVNYREFSGGFDVLLKVIKLDFED